MTSFAALFLESPLDDEEKIGVPWSCGCCQTGLLAARRNLNSILLVSLSMEWARLFRLSVGTDGCLGTSYAIH